MAVAQAAPPATPARSDAPAVLTIRNPITGETLAQVPIATPAEVQAAADRARAAQPAWEALGVRERSRRMKRFGELLWQDRERIMHILHSENGKPMGGAWGEVVVLDNMIHYYSRVAPRLLKPQRRKVTVPVAQTARVIYKPYPVVGFLTPWNYPLQNALIDAVAALFAGCAVILKPSEITPLTLQAAVELMHQAGIPADIAQVITGDGRTGAALVDSVDYIALTGSTATGRRVAQRAAERLIPCSLELGGKDPAIVLDDADLDLAASWCLVGAMENAGQVCVSTERVYVVDAIYDAFLARLLEWAGRIRLSAGDDLDAEMSTLTNLRELERTEAHIADAVAGGAKVVFGGQRRPDLGPLFFEPTILVDVTPDMRIMREETFGPVLPIMRVRDADEAVAQANASDYGLSAVIFTRHVKRGMALAERIESGDVMINHPMFAFGIPDLPMGGVKDSGMGRRNGPEGLLRFVRTQSILSDRMWLTGPSLSQTNARIRGFYRVVRPLRRIFPWM